jgi:cell division protease FtsH
LRWAEKNISAELKQPLPDGRRLIYTVRLDPEFAKELAQYGVKVTGVVEPRRC